MNCFFVVSGTTNVLTKTAVIGHRLLQDTSLNCDSAKCGHVSVDIVDETVEVNKIMKLICGFLCCSIMSIFHYFSILLETCLKPGSATGYGEAGK